jgi:hypothetical protein
VRQICPSPLSSSSHLHYRNIGRPGLPFPLFYGPIYFVPLNFFLSCEFAFFLRDDIYLIRDVNEFFLN